VKQIFCTIGSAATAVAALRHAAMPIAEYATDFYVFVPTPDQCF
jgi:hypothetical protein